MPKYTVHYFNVEDTVPLKTRLYYTKYAIENLHACINEIKSNKSTMKHVKFVSLSLTKRNMFNLITSDISEAANRHIDYAMKAKTKALLITEIRIAISLLSNALVSVNKY
jgi:hypothetical protein